MLEKIIFNPVQIVACNGTSIWRDTHGKKVTVSSIDLGFWNDKLNPNPEFNGYIYVNHRSWWEIYTDTGFEQGISKLVSKAFGKKIQISFTEQGMQEQHRASMEVDYSKLKSISKFLKSFPKVIRV